MIAIPRSVLIMTSLLFIGAFVGIPAQSFEYPIVERGLEGLSSDAILEFNNHRDATKNAHQHMSAYISDNPDIDYASFSSDGSYIATIGYTGSFAIWDSKSGAQLISFAPPAEQSYGIEGGWGWANIKFLPESFRSLVKEGAEVYSIEGIDFAILYNKMFQPIWAGMGWSGFPQRPVVAAQTNNFSGLVFALRPAYLDDKIIWWDITNALLDGFRNGAQADADKDGVVSVGELGEFVKGRLPAIQKETGLRQTPRIMNVGQDIGLFRVKDAKGSWMNAVFKE